MSGRTSGSDIETDKQINEPTDSLLIQQTDLLFQYSARTSETVTDPQPVLETEGKEELSLPRLTLVGKTAGVETDSQSVQPSADGPTDGPMAD